MNNLYDFYNSILNLKSRDELNTIKAIVVEEKKKLLDYTESFEGFCIYIASQIEAELKEKGITTYSIDLEELVGVNHVVLIAEYMYENEMKRVLIDPTFSQFTKEENKKLLKLDEWPCEKISVDMKDALLLDGCCFIDNTKFNSYINAFSDKKLILDLDEYVFQKRHNRYK